MTIKELLRPSIQEGVEHGPYAPVDPDRLHELQNKDGFHLSDIALNSLYQLIMHDHAASHAHLLGYISSEASTALMVENYERYGDIKSGTVL